MKKSLPIIIFVSLFFNACSSKEEKVIDYKIQQANSIESLKDL